MKKIINLIIFGLLIFCFSINLAFSSTITKEYNISENDLPVIYQESFLLQLQENETLYFNQGNISSNYLELEFPSNYTFGINETNYTFNINANIFDFTITQNTTIQENMIISNSLNNLSTEILFKFNIKDEPLNVTTIINNSQTYEVSIIEGGYNVTISSNTLPKGGILDFELTGFPNQNGIVTYCGDFLTCPSNFQFNANGEVTLPVSYNIPYGQAVGTYSRVIAIQSNGTFRQAKVIFNIIEPQYVIQHYVYQDDCFLNKENMIRCVREQQEYDSERLTELINELMKEDKSICPTVNETIKYVMQGEINQSMKMLYDNAIKDLNNSRSQNGLLIQENKELKLENSKLMAEKDTIQTDANTLVKEAQDEAFKVKINSEQKIENMKIEAEDVKDFWFWFAFWSIAIAIVVGLAYYKTKKDNWWH